MFLAVILACSFLTSAAMDEPPSRLIVQADGSVRMIFDAPTPDAQQPTVDGGVPVFTELEDGRLVPGISYTGTSATGYHATRYPGAVVRAEDGSWTVENFKWSVIHGPKNRQFTRTILGSDSAMILDHRNPAPLPRGTMLTWTYDHTGAPSYLPESQVRAAIYRAISVYENLFKDDAISSSFRFVWEADDPLTLAYAEVIESGQTFSSIRTSILNTYAANPADANTFENGLYTNFPPGSSIGYARPGNATDSTSVIKIVWPLRTKFTGAGFGSSLRIVMNSNRADFDADPSDDIGTWVGSTLIRNKKDFTATLIHELGHHFGFVSNVETLNFILEDSISVWDIFRMNAALGSIDPNEFFSARRELRQTMEANAALQINSTAWTLPLSQGETPGGDGAQSSHWIDDTNNKNVYIGLMEPHPNSSSYVVNGSYLQPTDIRAFDVMGYAINTNEFAPSPQPELEAPVNYIEIDPALVLGFQWVPGAGSTSSDLLVYDLGSEVEHAEGRGGDPVLVYRADDLTGGSLSVPPATFPLLPGHVYQWHVAVYNPMGVRLSDSEFFRVDCIADWNGDGTVNFFDLSAYMAAFNAMDPAADLAAPFGVWNFFDLSAFTALHTAGCP